ncbi:MAG: NAD-dependent deacylase [Bacteroidales bacterium]|jgi:NAD-dependent deacetylase|nr:NAD-dependent deacylase [Bacteroidales bacterium]
MKKQKLVVLSGAGISQESGIATYRDKDGLWEKYDPMALATPEAWMSDSALVLEFYNVRREKVLQAEPNPGHLKLAELEQNFDVQIVTQNVDDLHERAGSTRVLHLHGEIRKARSTKNPALVYDIAGADLNIGDYCELGSQLRPHIVWFGEAVPNIEPAVEIIADADILLVIGTSLNVYPAAGLIDYAPQNCRKFLIDPGEFSAHQITDVHVIQEKAGAGMQQICELLSAK